MQFRKVVLNLLSSYIHIVVSVVLNIFYVPIALKYLGVDKYGAWILLTTVINFLALANFGVPTAVTSLMSSYDTKNSKAELLLTGFKILSWICFIVLILGGVFFWFVDNVTSWLDNLSSEIKYSSITLIFLFVCRIPFQISYSVFTASKKLYLAKLFDLLTVAFNFFSLLFIIYLEADLVVLSIVSGVSLLILNVISYLQALKIVDISTYVKPQTPLTWSTIYRPGASLFIVGLSSLIVWNTDNLIISNFFSLKEVAIYSTAFRLFSIAYMSFSLFHGVIIPYYGEYFRDERWERLTDLFQLNLIILPLIAVSVWIIGFLFSKEIIGLWLGGFELYADPQLYFFLGAYGVTLAFVGAMSNLLTSLNLLKSLVYFALTEAILNFVASILAIRVYGYSGVALGTLIASTACPLVFLPFLIRKNKELKISFPFIKMYTSILIYTIPMWILYFFKINECQFYFRVIVAAAYLSFFALYQGFYNIKLLVNSFSIFKK